MEKVKRVIAVLMLVWVTDILLAHIFPRTGLMLYTYCQNFGLNWWGAVHGNKESQLWLLVFYVLPASLIALVVFAGIGVQSVIARGIKKARG